MGPHTGRLAHPGIRGDARAGRVGDPAVARQQRHMGERCLGVGGHERRGLRQPVGHVLGDHDVGGGGVGEVGPVGSDVEQPTGGDALAVDRHRTCGDELGVSHHTIAEGQSFLGHAAGDLVVLR